jgi:hypothetical protein
MSTRESIFNFLIVCCFPISFAFLQRIDIGNDTIQGTNVLLVALSIAVTGGLFLVNVLFNMKERGRNE